LLHRQRCNECAETSCYARAKNLDFRPRFSEPPKAFSSGFAMVAPVSFQYSNGAFDFYGCNHPTLHQIDAGGTVHVAVVGGGALSQATVNLSGHLVPE